jgi:cobalt-zinc-cadmium efflux system outer membrane protein
MGGKRDRRVAIARLAVDLAGLSVPDRERQLRADVKARFGEALAAIRNLESTEHLLELTGQSLRIAGARARVGEGAPLEEALIQVEANRLQSDHLLFENQVQRALLELKTLAGIRMDEPLQIIGDLAAPPVTLTLVEALDRALGQRPDLKAARIEEELGEAETLLARTEAVPNVVLSGRYSRVSSRFDQLGYSSSGGPLVPLRDTDHILAGSVSIPLPVRNRNQGNIQAALARRQASLLRAQYLEQLVRREVESAYGRFESVRRALELFDQGVIRQSENNLSVLRAAYDLGELRLLDVINEQRRLVETQKSYTEILKESYLAAAELERVVGTPIF